MKTKVLCFTMLFALIATFPIFAQNQAAEAYFNAYCKMNSCSRNMDYLILKKGDDFELIKCIIVTIKTNAQGNKIISVLKENATSTIAYNQNDLQAVVPSANSDVIEQIPPNLLFNYFKERDYKVNNNTTITSEGDNSNKNRKPRSSSNPISFYIGLFGSGTAMKSFDKKNYFISQGESFGIGGFTAKLIMNNNIGIGLSASYLTFPSSVFRSSTNNTNTSGSVSIYTGVVIESETKDMRFNPILFSLDYIFFKGSFRPYAGISGGLYLLQGTTSIITTTNVSIRTSYEVTQLFNGRPVINSSTGQYFTITESSTTAKPTETTFRKIDIKDSPIGAAPRIGFTFGNQFKIMAEAQYNFVFGKTQSAFLTVNLGCLVRIIGD